MARTLGRLAPKQYYQASGEATPQAELPQQFISTNQPASPVAGNQQFVREYWHDIHRMSYVDRHERLNGMRTMYQRGMTRMPIQRDGADGNPRPWNSAANRNDMGPIRNGHYNDALYQAGYPGYNLGLSFKVQSINTINSAARSVSNTPGNINVSTNTTPVGRAIGKIKSRWGRSAS